jgi:hypothetical protein
LCVGCTIRNVRCRKSEERSFAQDDELKKEHSQGWLRHKGTCRSTGKIAYAIKATAKEPAEPRRYEKQVVAKVRIR